MPESSERRPEAPSLAGARPQRSRRPEAVAALRRAQSRIDQRFRQLLQTTGVTLQQFEVLRILRGAGSSGLATLAIADRMADRAPGVTRLLDRLEKRQLVQRTRGEDRRQVLCSITPSGLELLDSLGRFLRVHWNAHLSAMKAAGQLLAHQHAPSCGTGAAQLHAFR